jgi:hypothetical protein
MKNTDKKIQIVIHFDDQKSFLGLFWLPVSIAIAGVLAMALYLVVKG